jgi:hypothetical protein
MPADGESKTDYALGTRRELFRVLRGRQQWKCHCYAEGGSDEGISTGFHTLLVSPRRIISGGPCYQFITEQRLAGPKASVNV